MGLGRYNVEEIRKISPHIADITIHFADAPEDTIPYVRQDLTWVNANELYSSEYLNNFWNGTFVESIDALAVSDGVNVSLELEQSGGGDLQMRFSDGLTVLDCTPKATVTLNDGTLSAPVQNFVYIPISTKVLTVSTTNWPSEEHIRVTFILCQGAANAQAVGGTFINQNWNDHIEASSGQGHLSHITSWIRRNKAVYFKGIDPNGVDDYLTITAGDVRFMSTAGSVSQLHLHDFLAKDTTTDFGYVVNDFVGAYTPIQNLFDITADSTGTSIGNNKWFNLVVWGVANKGGTYDPIMFNLPNGSYNSQSGAEADLDKTANFTMPAVYTTDSSTGFLICLLTIQMGSTWNYGSFIDLRGKDPITASGSSTGAAGGQVDSVVQGTDITVDNSDPVNPIVNWTGTHPVTSLTTTGTSGASTLIGGVLNIPIYGGAGAGGQVDSLQDGTDITIDSTDPVNPIVNFTGTYFTPDTLLNDYGFTDNSSQWDTAFSWGDHSLVGYLTSFTEADPIFTAHTVSSIIDGTGLLKNDGVGNWTYDNSTYLTSYTETDPIFIASAAFGISGGDITNWNTAYTNRITSLTTTGTSGAATLISNVLNIPNYGTGSGMSSFFIREEGIQIAEVVNGEWIDFIKGVGTVISVSGATNPTVSFSVDYTDNVANVIRGAASLPVAVNTADQLLLASEDTGIVYKIDVSDLPFTNNVGIVTSIGQGAGTVVTGTAAIPIVNVSYAAGSANVVQSANNGEGISIDGADVILFSDSNTGDVVFRGLVSNLPFTNNIGDITGVNITAGDGLKGSVSTLSGAHVQTLNIEYDNTNNLVYKAATLSNPLSSDYFIYHDTNTQFARKTTLANVNVHNLNDINIMYDNEVNGYTKTQYFTLTNGTTSSGTYNVDLDSNQVHLIILDENINLTVSNMKAGATYIMIIRQPETAGPYTVSWPSNIYWPDDVEPIMTATDDRADLFTFVAISSSALYGSYNQNYDSATSGGS